MQKIERVGAVALLFLLVTIVAVALWDDGSSGEAIAAERDEDVASAQPERPGRGQQATRNRQNPNQGQAAGQQGGQRASQQGGQQGGQAANQRDRHDDLRATRATGRDQQPSLLGNAGQVAPVPAPGANDPSLTVQPGARRQQEQGNTRRAQDPNLGDGLIERGWGRGAGTVEQPATTDRGARDRAADSRKRKQAEARTQAQVAAGGQHKVGKNETLERIARARLGDGSRWPEIALINGIEGPRYMIRENQVLRLPAGAKPATAQPAAPRQATPNQPAAIPRAKVASAPAGGSRTYKIKKHDVLSKISQRELGTWKRWKEIVALNPGLDPNNLHVGTQILLPVAGAKPSGPVQSLVADAGSPSTFRVR